MWNGPIPSISMGSGKMRSKGPFGHRQNGSAQKVEKIICSSCLFGTEIRQINMLSKRLENRSEEYYIYHKAKVDLIWITGEKISICFL